METYLNKNMEQAAADDGFEETEMMKELSLFIHSDLQEVAKIFRQSSVTELEVEDEEYMISMVRESRVIPPTPVQQKEEPDKDLHMEHMLKPVVSEYLGVLHLEDLKGSPYVKPGDRVKVGQTLAAVETMNILNEIRSTREGKVIRILEDDGNPVEYGQILFFIDVTPA